MPIPIRICRDAEKDDIRKIQFVLNRPNLPREWFKVPVELMVGSSEIYDCCGRHFQAALKVLQNERPDCVLYW